MILSVELTLGDPFYWHMYVQQVLKIQSGICSHR